MMTAREGRVAEAFVELADSLAAGFEIVDFLHRVVDRTLDLLDADAAGIVVADQRGQLQVLASSSQITRVLELFELQSESGPCLDSFRTGCAVTPPDLMSMRSTWPTFTARAEASGYQSVQSVPMRLRDEVIGVFTMYRAREGVLADVDLRLARALADVATISLITNRAMNARQVLADQLQHALDSRVLLEQAKGVLAGRQGISLEQAFTDMRHHARRSGLTLRAVATAVINEEGAEPTA